MGDIERPGCARVVEQSTLPLIRKSRKISPKKWKNRQASCPAVFDSELLLKWRGRLVDQCLRVGCDAFAEDPVGPDLVDQHQRVAGEWQAEGRVLRLRQLMGVIIPI